MLDKTIEERILKALNHEEGDRVPIWDYLDNRGIYDYLLLGRFSSHFRNGLAPLCY